MLLVGKGIVPVLFEVSVVVVVSEFMVEEVVVSTVVEGIEVPVPPVPDDGTLKV